MALPEQYSHRPDLRVVQGDSNHEQHRPYFVYMSSQPVEPDSSRRPQPLDIPERPEMPESIRVPVRLPVKDQWGVVIGEVTVYPNDEQRRMIFGTEEKSPKTEKK